MLSTRSASLIRMTRRSRAMASSILRKFSAARSSRVFQGICPSLVTPSTSAWISGPNSWPMSSAVALVSSTQSCSRPAQTEGTSSLSSAMILATPRGWTT
jgi:hypothetical protein